MDALEYIKQRKNELKVRPATKIKNADKAKELISKFSKIYIIGDYDADGILGVTSAYLALKELGKEVKVRFPKRFTEGYGLSEKIVNEIIENESTDTLICTIDNGIAAFNEIKKLKDNGFNVLLTDHHLVPTDNGEPIYPPADAIINESDGFSNGNTPWCGAGLVYAILKELDISLSTQTMNNITLLTGIATVGDVVPLVNGNRKLVKEAINIANNMEFLSPSLLMLLQSIGSEKIDEGTFGFQIVPMINAPGRLFDDGAKIVFDTLITPDFASIQELLQLNEQRKDLSFKYTTEAKGDIDEKFACPSIDVPLGICGLVAGNLCEEFNRPSFVFSKQDDILKGSGRSVPGINIVETVKRINDKNPDLIIKFGGHAAAMGLAIKKDKFNDFKKALEEELPKIPQKEFKYDAEVDIRDDFNKIYKEMSGLKPFGEGNPAPVFLLRKYIPKHIKGQDKYALLGRNEEHIKFFNGNISAIGFSMADTYFKEGEPNILDLLITPEENVFRCKKSIQLTINNLRAAK